MTLLDEEPPSRGEQFRVWLTLGMQSFGGGLATLALIRRTIVEGRRWVSEDEFTRDWTLVQLAPGINLLALTILIGRRTGGARGIALALLGLLLPSVSVAIGLTALYGSVQHFLWVQAALRGIVPATVGIGLLTAFQIARPLVAASRREGRAALILSLMLLAVSALLALRGRLPVAVILLAAGLAGALSRCRHVLRSDAEAP
jgi:chromate transporter